MSDNIKEGKEFYLKSLLDHKSWFEEQVKIWPNRYDKNKTTNLAFLYGCLLGYREENKKDPKLSEQFLECIWFYEKDQTAKPK